jgi:ATP-dependent Clp protease ATP-binding subunit ClpA
VGNKPLASFMFLGTTGVGKIEQEDSFLFSTESVVRSRAAKTLRDPQGPKIDFRNTIISLTSNLGADILVGADFLHVYKVSEGGEVLLKAKRTVMDVVQASYPPEFLNRVNEFIISKRLFEVCLRYC